MPEITKVRYTHEAIIDLVLSRPGIRQAEIAALIERTPAWVSTIMASDAFKAKLEERRAEVVDPYVAATVNDRLQAVAHASLERILEKVSTPGLTVADDFLVKTAKLATDALGYGAKPAGGGSTTNVAVVVQVPQKLEAPAWEARYRPPPAPPALTTGD